MIFSVSEMTNTKHRKENIENLKKLRLLMKNTFGIAISQFSSMRSVVIFLFYPKSIRTFWIFFI